MDEQRLLALKPELDRFLDRFAPLFGTEQNQTHARCFVPGLLHQGERRNSANIAQAIAGCNVRNLQAFITTAAWHDDALLTEMRCGVLEVLADDDAACNYDETGFAKKGSKSVGVKRQYSGTLGRTDNCQIGVFANYCSAQGHTFMDRRLFLPKEWADDLPRRQEAGVPDTVIFRTKPELALEMLTRVSMTACRSAGWEAIVSMATARRSCRGYGNWASGMWSIPPPRRGCGRRSRRSSPPSNGPGRNEVATVASRWWWAKPGGLMKSLPPCRPKHGGE